MVRDGRGLDDSATDNLPAGERQKQRTLRVTHSSPAVATASRQYALCEVRTCAPCLRPMHVVVFLLPEINTIGHHRSQKEIIF